MKQKFICMFLFMILVCLSGCSKRSMSNSTEIMTETADIISTPYPILSDTSSPKSEEILLRQFFEDAKVPEAVREQFTEAIHGDEEAQQWIDGYENANDDLEWSVKNAVFPYRNNVNPYLENECFFNIGQFYYEGDDYIHFQQNKEVAFEWLKLSADKGFFWSAIMAGDMAKSGDGVRENPQMVFSLYLKAVTIEPNGTAYERIGTCYENGVGTVIDKQKAYDSYLKSAFDGNAQGLYKLSVMAENTLEIIPLYKAAGSLDYDDGYFAMAYGGLEGYTVSNSKRELINRILEGWNTGADPAAVKLQKAVRYNEYFPKEFVEMLIKTSYTYSYHAVTEKYGVRTNRTYKDAQDIQFVSSEEDSYAGYEEDVAKNFLQYEESQFYELDFDGDGLEELGVPVHSGAGGAFMADGFAVFKKNKEGLYEFYNSGPDCTMRDAMRLLQYDGKIYFITNPFSDSKDALHDIEAFSIDKAGNLHTLSITGTDYALQHIVTHRGEAYGVELDGFLSDIEKQVQGAVDATKRHELYSPKEEKKLPFQGGEGLEEDFYASAPQDIFFAADINNDGIVEVIQKGHQIVQDKYYNEDNLFRIYKDREDFSKHGVSIRDYEPPEDDYYGLHSYGDLYELIPITGKIVQFWTQDYDGVTYSIAITRQELLYTLQVYVVKNQKASIVSQSLFFDEVQDMEAVFSEDASTNEQHK
jgi:TPR repeat protein